MHLQDARCMNSFSSRSAGRGMYCIVQLCCKKARQGDKGKVTGHRIEATGYSRKSFQLAHGEGKDMLRTVNASPTISLKKKKKLLPNLYLVPIDKSELYT